MHIQPQPNLLILTSAAGDWACTSDITDTVNNILDKNPELVLGLGDYSYEDTADCWLEIVEPIDNIMKIAIGNHEIEEGESILSQYMEHLVLQSSTTHLTIRMFILLHWEQNQNILI